MNWWDDLESKAQPQAQKPWWMELEPATERSWGETANDLGVGVARGATNLGTGLMQLGLMASPARGAAWAADKLLGTNALPQSDAAIAGVADFSEGMNESFDLRESAALQAKRQAAADAVDQNAPWYERAAQSAGAYVTDPALLGSLAAEQVAPLGGVLKTAGSVARSALQGALERGLPRDAAEEVARQAAIKANLAATGAQGGGYAADATVQDALSTPQDQLEQNQRYRALIADGLTPDEARNRFAAEAGSIAAAPAAVGSALAGKLTAGLESDIVTRKSLGGLRDALINGTLRGAAEESAQEGIEKGSQNLGAKLTTDPARDLGRGVPEAMGAAIVVGGLLEGSVAGGAELMRARHGLAQAQTSAEKGAATAEVMLAEAKATRASVPAPIDAKLPVIDPQYGTGAAATRQTMAEAQTPANAMRSELAPESEAALDNLLAPEQTFLPGQLGNQSQDVTNGRNRPLEGVVSQHAVGAMPGTGDLGTAQDIPQSADGNAAAPAAPSAPPELASLALAQDARFVGLPTIDQAYQAPSIPEIPETSKTLTPTPAADYGFSSKNAARSALRKRGLSVEQYDILPHPVSGFVAQAKEQSNALDTEVSIPMELGVSPVAAPAPSVPNDPVAAPAGPALTQTAGKSISKMDDFVKERLSFAISELNRTLETQWLTQYNRENLETKKDKLTRFLEAYPETTTWQPVGAQNDRPIPSADNVAEPNDNVATPQAAQVAEVNGPTEALRNESAAQGLADQRQATAAAQQDVEEIPFSRKEVPYDQRNLARLPGIQTERTRRLAAKLKLRGSAGSALAEVSRRHLPGDLIHALESFESATGTRVVVVKGLPANGVILRERELFVDVETESPILTTAAHEWTHQLKRDNPGLYKRLEVEVKRQGTLGRWHSELNRRSTRDADDPVDMDLATEELTADAVADAMTDQSFLYRLGQTNPTVFRRVVESFSAFLDRVIAKFKDTGSSKYLSDVQAFRDVLADVLKDYNGPESVRDGDVAVKFSARQDDDMRGNDHRISHRPMSVDAGSATLDDLLPAFGEDIYGSNALQYFGSGDPREADVLRILRRMRGKPDALVTIYRGAPAVANKINPGDWVTLSKKVADDYASQFDDGKVISLQVPAAHVTAWADTLLENGYAPPLKSADRPGGETVTASSEATPAFSRKRSEKPFYSALLEPESVRDGSLEPIFNRAEKDDSSAPKQPAPAPKQTPADAVFSVSEDQTQTPEFKRWFGDSKVVDADGKPLVVWHGAREVDTSIKDGRAILKPRFNIFDTSTHIEPGAWFSTDPKITRKYGTPIPFYLKASNPVRNESPISKIPQGADAVYRIRGKGNSVANAFEIAVFRPEQVKLAIGNRGTFDPDNPDILFSRRRKQKHSLKQRLQMFWDKFMDRIVDQFWSVVQTEREIRYQTWQPLPENQQVRNAENLRHGRFQNRLRNAVEAHLKPIAQILGNAKLNRQDFADYLWWRHAGERDSVLRAKHKGNPAPDALAGISPQDAADNINNLSAATRKAFETAAKHIDDLRQYTLGVLRDSGQISQETHDGLLNTWEHYVPLRGMPEVEQDLELDTASKLYGVGRGLSVKKDAIGPKAFGRKSKPSDIVEEMHRDLERALIGAEKQRVLGRVINLIQANPWVGSIDPVEQAKKEVNGIIQWVPKTITEGTLIFLHKGRPVRLKMANARMEAALLNLDGDNPFRVIARWTRWLSQVKTAWSPYFMLINPVRDAGFASLSVFAEHDTKTAKAFAKGYFPAWAAMTRHVRGTTKNKVMDRYAQEYSAAGGETGYTYLNNIEDIAKGLDRLFTKYGKGDGPRGTAKRLWIKSADAIEAGNRIAENTTRLAAFAAMREQGKSIEEAAKYAKDITVNFNVRGAWGSRLNALYMFFNAAVQGSRRFLSLVKQHPGRFGGLMAGMAISSYGLALSQMIEAGDDDDGESKYLKQIRDFDAQRAIPIRVGDEKFVSIPVPYGPNIFTYLGWKAAQLQYETMQGREVDLSEWLGDVALNVSNSMTPIQVERGGLALFPEVARIPIQMMMNRGDFGQVLSYAEEYRDRDDNSPLHQDADYRTPEAYRLMSQFMSFATGGNDYEAGWGEIAPEKLEYLVEQALGGMYRFANESAGLIQQWADNAPVNARDVPLSNVYVKSNDVSRQQAERFYENKTEINQAKEQWKLASQRGDEEKLEELRSRYDWIDTADADARTKAGKATQFGTPIGVLREANSEIKELRDERKDAYTGTGEYTGMSRPDRMREVRRIDREIANAQRALNSAMRGRTLNQELPVAP